MPTGMLSPLLETQSQGISPLWTPHYFLRLCIYNPHSALDILSLENRKQAQFSSSPKMNQRLFLFAVNGKNGKQENGGTHCHLSDLTTILQYPPF